MLMDMIPLVPNHVGIARFEDVCSPPGRYPGYNSSRVGVNSNTCNVYVLLLSIFHALFLLLEQGFDDSPNQREAEQDLEHVHGGYG